MKKNALSLALILCMSTLVGCSNSIETEQYLSSGRYYTNGYIITEDDNGMRECWIYEADKISDRTPYK